MMGKIRWGILGPGNIARKFAKGLSVIDDAELTAIGSRSKEKAAMFANEYSVATSYGSYEELVMDKNVDVVYIATPHPFHLEHALLCINAGKAVLVEKPMGVNAKQIREMIAQAQQNKVFLMEAMWTRFLPAIVKVRQWLAECRIGEVQMVKADFGFHTDMNPNSRLFDPNLGGGSLLDVGVYTVSFANMVFGISPSQVCGVAQMGETAVDERAGILFRYPQGQIAALTCAIRTYIPHNATIFGTSGSIHIPNFWRATSASLKLGDTVVDHFEQPHLSNGYECEAIEVMNCLRRGNLESAIMPHSQSLSVVETMDTLRSQWNLKYPFED